MRLVGIDPGVHGAVALLAGGRLIRVDDMPTSGGEVDGNALYRYLVGLYPIDAVFMEETHAMPKIGSQANYSQGCSKGAIAAAVTIAKLPLHRVAPATWKVKMGLRGKPKPASRELARELWPDMDEFFRLVKHHDRAEAALIARYGSFHLIAEANAS